MEESMETWHAHGLPTEILAEVSVIQLAEEVSANKIVVLDVRDGYVSLEGAKRDYGVCIDHETGRADEEKTKSVRSAMAAKFHKNSTAVNQPRPSDALEREGIGKNKS